MSHGSLHLSSFSPDEVDHLLDTATAWTQQLFTRMADAFMSVDDEPAMAVHQALAAMLRELAAAPEMTYISVVEVPSLGPLLHARREQTLELFSTFLDAASTALDAPPADREAIVRCVVGGLWETVRRYALDRRLHELPEALAGMSYFCLSTFFGVDEALRVGALPV
jgi:hypothetical protein